MSLHAHNDLSGFSMFDLFRVESETQCAALTEGLLAIERGESSPQVLETLMRAAHSIKGAARIINIAAGVRVAHALEDCFVAAQKGALHIGPEENDRLLKGVDLLAQISQTPEAEMANWETSRAAEINAVLASLPGAGPIAAPPPTPPTHPNPERRPPPRHEPVPRPPPAGSETGTAHKPSEPPATPAPPTTTRKATPAKTALEPEIVETKPINAPPTEEGKRVLRLNAENLNRLLGLAGESLVEARWIRPFTDSLTRLKRMQTGLHEEIEGLRDALGHHPLPPRAAEKLQSALHRATECRAFLGDRLLDLDTFDRRCVNLTHRLYLEALRTKMRPFADGVNRFPRMVRDIARSLGKEVRFEISGEQARVDRDILERLDAPLGHLLRNAIDHGCETPDERLRAGKPREATIRVEARHAAGMLLVTVSDDGAGIDPERIREVVTCRKLLPTGAAARLTEAELLQFLFLPGFTMRESVTDISGRGVGLDVVHNMVRGVRGNVRIQSQPGNGTRFILQLPITLSVLRTLLVEVAGEPYALPLAQIVRTQRLRRDQVESIEGHLTFRMNDEAIGLLSAQQVLDCGEGGTLPAEIPLVVLGERKSRYGLVVDKFLGERELVVQPLDPRLGKVKDISAAALMEDGSPVLIIDVDDLVRSIEKLISTGRLSSVRRDALLPAERRRKRVLVVDDSLTVRELERKLLLGRGYAVEVAVDGMDGWNALRAGDFDLIISDVDMPRLNGIELTEMIKKDPQFRALPVMIVSYKDREEDRLRGLEAGADYYLTKGSFHDETLLDAVTDLIGEPEE
jgi:two-component system, chemotaxis family, sensor histidine kinase and response regulator WspE